MVQRMTIRRREALEGYVFLLPWLVGFLLFTLGPLLGALFLGFTEWGGVGPVEWIGFKNYVTILTGDQLFWKSLQVTLEFALLYLPLNLLLGFSISLLMNQPLRGIRLFRTIYYLPSVVSGVAVSVLWGFVFHREYGVLNWLIGLVGLPRVAWLQNVAWVVPSLVIMELWRVGGSIIIYLGGLQGIPTELYDSATVDGANWGKRLWHITLPMMSPVIFFNLIIGIIGTLQVFTQAYVITKGGPNYASYFYTLNIYDKTFTQLRLGYASALAWLLFIIILLLTLVVFAGSRRWVYYAGERESLV